MKVFSNDFPSTEIHASWKQEIKRLSKRQIINGLVRDIAAEQLSFLLQPIHISVVVGGYRNGWMDGRIESLIV